MKRNTFCLILLLLVGTVSLFGVTPNVAYADGAPGHEAPTIEWIRIYLNPDTEWRRHTNPDLPGRGDRHADYVPIDANGEPQNGTLIDANNDVNSATPALAGEGTKIAIAIRLQNVTNVGAPINAKFANGGPSGSDRGLDALLSINRVLERRNAADDGWEIFPENQAKFTAVYVYTVQADDADSAGDWLDKDGSDRITPFGTWYVRSKHHTYKHRPGLDNVNWPGTVYYPKVDGSVSSAPKALSIEINDPPTRQSGPSRYHKVRQECLEHHGKFGDTYTAACPFVHNHGYSLSTGAKPVTLANSPPAAYYRAGDTMEFSVTFNEEVVVTGIPTMNVRANGFNADAEYISGSGTPTLKFQWTVREGQHTFGGLGSAHGLRRIGEGRITDRAGHEVARIPNVPNSVALGLETQFRSFFSGQATDYAHGIIKYLVDTVPARVWLTGLIKNGDTHTDDRWHAVWSLETAYADARAFTAETFQAPVTERDVQTGAFEVEFRFFNYHTQNWSVTDKYAVLADEVGESFTAADVEITGANVVRDEWGVEVAYVGLDHRALNAWPPSDRPGQPAGSVHSPGDAKNSASFLVYKATITPPTRGTFNGGEVQIRVPAGATHDIARNPSLASNTLTVTVADLRPPVVIEPPTFVKKPEGEVYTLAENISVEVTFDEEDVVYVGDAPPYVTLYLGERAVANARHATWQRGSERSGSTKVTFAYPIQVGDSAESVSLDPSGVSIPRGTSVRDGDGNAVAGTAPPPVAPTERVKELPTREETDTAFPETTVSRPPAIETTILPVYPIFDVEDPKAAATDVPEDPIVFNELGNGSGDADDWLELRNVTGSAVSLKDWELSIVQDGKKEDTSLIAFVEDVSVPANGLLLLVNTSPDKTSLAGGDNVTTAEVETKGSSHLYFVNAGLSLPDDGKFLLILRNAKEKLGLNKAFVDVAGGGGSDTDAFIREQTGDYDTHVWPLQVLQAPGGDTEDALGSGKVWQRAKADIVGYHRDAWAESAFTGIGYDRKVTESPATSGTPGYPNGAVKTEAATPKGSVTLSEIMFDSGGGTLPQWIELYNNSKTDAINLNRWELEIQNVDSEDLIGRPIVTLTLSEKVIQPNQTLLIVAGPARASSDSYLPADRVYDLLALHDKNLRIKRARDTFLSTEGFYLQLSDRNGNLVDEVGNRDSDRRSDDAPAWALPLSFEEGSRSSIIRRYDKGVALPGRKRASWVLASRIKPFDESLHYGHADDIGTPGHREGGALPVELSSFSMTRTEAGAVVLTWTTESEVDNAGFNLRRSEKRASGFTLLNPALIAGAGTTGERQTYTFTDTSAKPGIEYYYQIEEVAFDGKPETLVTRLLPGPVSASNRMLTTFGEVKKTK